MGLFLLLFQQLLALVALLQVPEDSHPLGPGSMQCILLKLLLAGMNGHRVNLSQSVAQP